MNDESRRLAERAHFAVFQGRLDDAERMFREILQTEHVSAIANNLALLELNRHNRPEEALRVLSKNLDEVESGAQPYAQALAARCLVRLGRKEEAREAVERAVRHFEAGLPQMGKSPDARRAWQEYTSCLLESAGQLEDHRFVWELYQRWTRHHVRDTSHYFGGVAAFNLRRFRSARAAWGRIQDRGKGFMDVWDTVAWWCEIGVMEPFMLEYAAVGPKTGKEIEAHFRALPRGPEGVSTEDYLRAMGELLDSPVDRLWLVWKTFRRLLVSRHPIEMPEPDAVLEAFQGALAGVTSLVGAGGEWGKGLARRLLFDVFCHRITKVYAALGLELAGHIRHDEPVSLWWEGETRQMTISEMLDEITKGAKEQAESHSVGVWPPPGAGD